MAYEMRPNTGALFKNEEKEDPNHADYQGEALIDGTVYWFNAWIKTGKSGKKFMSCAFKPKAAKQEPKTATKTSVEELDEDLPF